MSAPNALFSMLLLLMLLLVRSVRNLARPATPMVLAVLVPLGTAPCPQLKACAMLALALFALPATSLISAHAQPALPATT